MLPQRFNVGPHAITITEDNDDVIQVTEKCMVRACQEAGAALDRHGNHACACAAAPGPYILENADAHGTHTEVGAF